MTRLKQGIRGRAGEETRSVKLQDGAVMARQLASGCAAREWHKMNLRRAVQLPCPLSSSWWPAPQPSLTDNELQGGWCTRICYAMLGISSLFLCFLIFFHSFSSNLEL